MKNLSTYLLFFVGTLAYLSLLGNRSGSPTGRTGAPGESTCATSGCHNSTLNSGSATINLGIDDGVTAYVPSQTHKVSISIDSPQAAGRNGFEIVALDAQDMNVGSWILSGDDKRTRSSNGKDYVTHTNNGSGQSSWEIDWKAPDSDAGAVTFYLAVNDANNNGGRTGDDIYTTSLEVSVETVSSVNNINSLKDISVYPNPIRSQINLKVNLTEPTKLSARLVNSLGQLIEGQLFQYDFPAGATYFPIESPSGLNSGFYFLELRNEDGGVKTIPIRKL